MEHTHRPKIVAGLVLILLLISVGPAMAVHDLGLFELDRNALDPGGAPLPDDWGTLYAGGGSAGMFTEILPDIGEGGGSQFQGGGSKDDLDISQWLWKYGEPLDKDDLTNAYAAAYVNPVDTGSNNVGDLILYYGLDRFSANGSAQVGFWFLQDPDFGLTSTPSGGGYKFSGAHMDNDVLVQSNFSRGGVVDSVTVYKWLAGALVPVYTAADCLGPPAASGDEAACATVNRSPQAAPWPYSPKPNEGSPGTFLTGGFFEGGINITRLVPEAGCFTGFLAETRTSTPFDARLKDFVAGETRLCQLDVDKSGSELSKVGDDVSYTVTITNNGALTLYKADIDDFLLGSIALDGVDQANPYVVSNTCGVSLATGASCTITMLRTVLEGDPDPLPNTVTAFYNGRPDLTGLEVDASDDHWVNLFQPSIAVDKTGNFFSKPGQVVDYVFTLSNTSSDDSPDLYCTAEDTHFGTIFEGMLPPGDTNLYRSRLVLPEDPDPLVNTVTLTCSPEGFPNVLTATDSHSVSLVEPKIAVKKTGDTLSKVGDDVHYQVTLFNNSSASTPPLNCVVEDSLMGVIFEGVLPLGETEIEYTRTVQPEDPDPLVNTVDLTCSPEGSSAVLEASASHTVNLFQPAIAVDKTGDSQAEVGDEVLYIFKLSNLSSDDAPEMDCTAEDTHFGTIFDGILPPGDTMLYITRTVQPDDPNPLENTVTLTCSPIGFPNVLTASDSHAVDLLGPAIEVDKTGDWLSKVGDDVNYTITLSNITTGPLVELACVAEDSLLGTVYEGFLPMGDTVIYVTRTVQPGDPDPLVNTVTLTCSVSDSPLVLQASDSHTTELFQPAVEVVKSGPDAAAPGDTVSYSFTINNLSSEDAPDLVLNSVTDTVLGDLTSIANLNGCATLPWGGSCSFTFDYTLLSTDPNPLVNVVTVHYNPDGFPNDIFDDDNHSLTVQTGGAAPGCTPGFWQGGAGSVLWDESDDPQWTYNGTNPFVHTTLFNDFFDLVTDPRLDGYTMYDLVSGGGGPDPALKAARDMVAAYLNELAFPAEFSASSLADLEDYWFAAVVGGDPALSEFHLGVGYWNDYGDCPLP